MAVGSNSEFDDNDVDYDVEAFWRLSVFWIIIFQKFKSAKHPTMPDIQALVFECRFLGVRIDSGIIPDRV